MSEEDIRYPICPLNMYFEGDEDKFNYSKCDYDYETRSCSQSCSKSLQKTKKDNNMKWALRYRKTYYLKDVETDFETTKQLKYAKLFSTKKEAEEYSSMYGRPIKVFLNLGE